MASTDIAFRAGISRRLRRRGLRGRSVAVSFRDERLTVAGDTFGVIDVDLAQIRRLRVGFAQSRSTTYRQVLVWSEGSGVPLLLGTADAAEHARFAALVRALADSLLRARHRVRVETGESKRWAAVMLILFGGLALAAIALVAFVLGESEAALGVPRLAALALPGVLLAGALAAMWWAWTRHWPRRIRSLAGLDRVLPC